MSMAACLAPMGVVTSLANADTNVVSSRTRPGATRRSSNRLPARSRRALLRLTWAGQPPAAPWVFT